MARSVEDYRKEITRQMKAHKLYCRGLDMQILSLASAMRNLDLANAEIDGLEVTTVWEKTRYGEKLAPHPVFKVAKEAQDMVTRQMKALGLTTAGLTGDVEDDPLVEVTRRLARKRMSPEVILPEVEG